MSKIYLIFFCLGIIAATEVRYIITPSQSQYCDDQCYYTEPVDNHLTLSQFIKNSTNYLTNDTILIFSPGNYSLESELVVKNVHSFSMLAWPSTSSSSEVVIICDHNTRLEFGNASIVTVRGMEFVGCFKNHVLFVGHLQLEDSSFYIHDQAKVNGKILIIDESAADLFRVVFAFVLKLPEDCNATISPTERVTGISLNKSILRITQSLFKENNLCRGGIIHDEFSSDITIINTTFVNNSAGDLHPSCNYCDKNTVCNAILYAKSNGSSIKIYDSKFVQNIGVIIFGDNCNMLITHTQFISNSVKYGRFFARIYATNTNLDISHSTFTNNTGHVLNVRHTNMNIRYTEFVSNNGSIIIYIRDEMITTIDNSKFINNNGMVSTLIQAEITSVRIRYCEFVGNTGVIIMNIIDGIITSIDNSKFFNNTMVLLAENTSVTISHSDFIFNSDVLTYYYGGMITEISIDHSKFIRNTGSNILYVGEANMVSITHSEFIDNTVTESLINLDGVIITVSLSEFVNNRAGTTSDTYGDVVFIPYYTTAENFTNNVFIKNSAAYEVFIGSFCRPGHDLSLGNSHCIKCNYQHWYKNLIGTVIAGFIAGIALVIFILALNMTVAVGTLNGIFFFANVVAANADTYFLPFTTPNFVTVFISWLNLDIGFNICYFASNKHAKLINNELLYKALIQLIFPAYVIFLVIVVIVASECSSKFAGIIGKGNPVAVLATMILLSYAKFIDTILASFSLLYSQPAYGSRKVDITKLRNVVSVVEELKSTEFRAISYFLLAISILILLLCIIYTVLIFSWQWLLRYKDIAIFKWVRYQKLHHFIEPYHAPYTAKYRYWTGLLLLVRAFLSLISVINFSLDPRVDLTSTIFVIGGLILMKGMTAKRVYKNWPLDIMETAIYFNLVALSAFTWYNLDFGGNQIAVAYTSVMIIFVFLLGIIVFHMLCYTRLYKCSFVEKAFKWTYSKLMKQDYRDDDLEELDGSQLERSAAGYQELPAITHSVVELY